MKKVQRVFPLLLLGVLCGIALGAKAAPVDGEQDYAYLGGGIGYGRMNGQDFTNTDGDLTNSRVSWKGLAGFRLNRVVSLEGQYVDFGADDRGNDRIQATGWTLGAVLDIPVTGPVTPYGKVGVLEWQTRNRFNDISQNQNGSNIALGAGLRFSLSRNVDLRAEYERFAMDDTRVDSFSAILQYDFL